MHKLFLHALLALLVALLAGCARGAEKTDPAAQAARIVKGNRKAIDKIVLGVAASANYHFFLID